MSWYELLKYFLSKIITTTRIYATCKFPIGKEKTSYIYAVTTTHRH